MKEMNINNLAEYSAKLLISKTNVDTWCVGEMFGVSWRADGSAFSRTFNLRSETGRCSFMGFLTALVVTNIISKEVYNMIAKKCNHVYNTTFVML